MEVLRFTTVLKNWNRGLTEKSDNRPTMEFTILLLPLAITKSTSRRRSHLDLGPGNPNIQFRVRLASLPLRCVFARSPACVCVCFFVFSLISLRVLSVFFCSSLCVRSVLCPVSASSSFTVYLVFNFSEFGRVWRVYWNFCWSVPPFGLERWRSRIPGRMWKKAAAVHRGGHLRPLLV